MRLDLVNAESYSPLDLLVVWSQIASSMGDKVPAAFNAEDFLMALFDGNDVHAHIVLNQAQREAEQLVSRERTANLTPIDFVTDTGGEGWSLSFTCEKGTESMFATTITLRCTGMASEDQPPLRAVAANELWIDINLELVVPPTPTNRLQVKRPMVATNKLLRLLKACLLQDDQNL